MALQQIVADALSYYSATEPGHKTNPNEIFVRGFACHQTDVNPAAIEVEINAGRSHGRDAQKVSDLVEARVRQEPLLPNSLLGPDGFCVWTHFHENDGFTQSKPYDSPDR